VKDHKLCKDCFHFTAYQDLCMRPVEHDLDLVYGTTHHPLQRPAKNERGVYELGCAPEAKYWERRSGNDPH
jgi:hypothetical protein